MIADEFNKLKEAYPGRLEDATLLTAKGYAGLVADHGDGSVTKIIHQKTPGYGPFETLEEVFDNEIRFLKHFRDHPLEDMQAPALIGDPVLLDKDDNEYFAMYRMTKISGHDADWKHDKLPEFETPEMLQQHFRSAGRLLAQFHRSTEKMDLPAPNDRDTQPASRIPQIEAVDEKTNEALARADRYLQVHKKHVIGHGDFHGGNIMIDDDGNVTGFIDPALAGHMDNHLFDFINVPSEARPYFIEGYEEESGETIDPLMMTMTEISLLTNTIIYSDNEDAKNRATGELERKLSEAGSVTGYNPV